MGVRVLATGDDCTSWVSVCWMEGDKEKGSPPFWKEHATGHRRVCVLFRLCRIRADFYPCTIHAMEYLYVWEHQQRERNKTKQKDAHTTHNTKWDCAPLFCICCYPDCGNYLPGFTSLFFHSKGSFWNRVTLNSV